MTQITSQPLVSQITIRRFAAGRVLRWALAGLTAVTLISTIAIPATRRRVADAWVTWRNLPAEGVTTIAVRGDALHGHVFDPPLIRIPRGTTVTWDFQDVGEFGRHNVVSVKGAGKPFASQVLLSGQYSHRFDTPGRYVYECTLHTLMRGHIEVLP